MKFVILGISVGITLIALFLNLAVPSYHPSTTTNDRWVTIVSTASIDNITIASAIPLINCRNYIQNNVPNVTGLVPFNATSLIATATAALNALSASLQGTGSITTLLSGNVTVNSNPNVTLTYQKRYMTLGNGTFYYVNIPINGTLISANATSVFSLDGWTSLIYPSGGAYNATDPVFDEQQWDKIRGGPSQPYLTSRYFIYTAIVLVDPTAVGTVVQVRRSLML